MVVVWGSCFFLRRLIQLPALLCCEAMVWAVTFLTLPLRTLTAVDRETKLIGEMQAQMDDLVWVNRDLEEKLQAALRDHDAMDALLDEMEDANDDAVARIHHLEVQLKALRQENVRLNEHKGKSMWDKASSEPETKPPWAPVPFEKVLAGTQQDYDAAVDFKVKSSADDPASVLSLTTADDDALAAWQAMEVVARRRSLFSLAMSVAVGGVAWSADAPCLPLLAGLFAVVGVSMRTVSRCCGAPRRGGDAVALLSLNWFLLGVLTSPMLPGVARAVVPRAAHVLGPVLTWFAAAAAAVWT